jgi:hypothetical protein
MGWSLIANASPREPELVALSLLAIGKALYLCNMFEHKCRYVLRMANLAAHLEVDPSASLTDAIACSQIAEQRFEHISSCTHFPTSVINVPRRGSQPGTAGSPVSDISPLGASA